MQVDIPLFKTIQRPLLPIAGSWVDAAPFAIFFVLLSAAPFLLRLPRPWRTIARRSVQTLSAYIFILFLHRCLCMLRGWVFALKIVGRNDLIAFGHLCMFVLLVAFTLRFGRVFCGWLCPLGFFSELVAGVARRRARLPRRLRLLTGYLMLAGAVLVMAWLAYLFRPGTQFFSENVAAVWAAWLLLLTIIVLPFEFKDRKFKRLKYISLALWLLLSTVGVFVTSPWCTLFGDELDYSSGVALISILMIGTVLAMAWCRYLCPMGAALGWLAKFAPLRLVHRGSCTNCGQCAVMCPMGALDNGRIDLTSCIFCNECVGVCGFTWEDADETETVPATIDPGVEENAAHA